MIEMQKEWCEKGYMIEKHLTEMYMGEGAFILTLCDHPHGMIENDVVYLEEMGSCTTPLIKTEIRLLNTTKPAMRITMRI